MPLVWVPCVCVRGRGVEQDCRVLPKIWELWVERGSVGKASLFLGLLIGEAYAGEHMKWAPVPRVGKSGWGET